MGSQRRKTNSPSSGHFAATLGLLLEKGCPPDSEDICSHTALHHAARSGTDQSDLMRILLEHGSNVNHLNRHGSSAVMTSVMVGHPGVVDVLMEFGADLNLTNADGSRPLQLCMTSGPQVTVTSLDGSLDVLRVIIISTNDHQVF